MEDRLIEIAEMVARIASENSRLLQRLAENEHRFRRISMGVLRAQEAERRRISYELHDGVGQSLTALKIQLDLLAQSPAQGVGDSIEQLRMLAYHALQDVRQLSRLLRPHMLDDLGLLPTLRWLFRSFEQSSGIQVDFQHDGIDRRFDPDVETLVFRIIQEAVTNSAKHARTRSIEVRALATAARVFLTVQDLGVGFDAEAILEPAATNGGFGLRGIRDRVQLFGGRFSLHSEPGAGTLIEIDVPLGEQGDN
jgi:signal transduction histidine kinase